MNINFSSFTSELNKQNKQFPSLNSTLISIYYPAYLGANRGQARTINILIYSRSVGLWISLKTSLHQDTAESVRCVAWPHPVPVNIAYFLILVHFLHFGAFSALWWALLPSLQDDIAGAFSIEPKGSCSKSFFVFFFFARDAASKAPPFPCAEECDGSIPQLRAPSSQQNCCSHVPRLVSYQNFK